MEIYLLILFLIIIFLLYIIIEFNLYKEKKRKDCINTKKDIQKIVDKMQQEIYRDNKKNNSEKIIVVNRLRKILDKY